MRRNTEIIHVNWRPAISEFAVSHKRRLFLFSIAALALSITLIQTALTTSSIEMGSSQTRADLPELILQTGHAQSIQSIAFGPDTKWIATGSYDGTIKIWDVEEGRELRALTGHSGAVKAITISPDGQRLASTAADKTVRIWNISSGGEEAKIATSDFAETLSFRSNGSQIVWGQSDGTIISRDLSSGSEQNYKGVITAVTALAISPDQTQLVAADSTGAVWI